VIENQELIVSAVKNFGSQSVVGVIDVKMTGIPLSPEVDMLNASRRTVLNPVMFAQKNYRN
jgi:imidazole glycerol-phosphate synthase subunit HisF